MRTAKLQKIERINRLLHGDIPLIWFKQGDTYKAGDKTISIEEFERLKQKNPMIIGWEEEKNYEQK